jgi:glycerol kinase
MSPNIMVIDQGTSSTKAVIVNESGDVLSASGVAVHPDAVNGGVEQQAALIGEHCVESCEVKCTYGTDAFLLITIDTEAKRSRNGLSSSVAWQNGEHRSYCLDGKLYSAGKAISVNFLMNARMDSNPLGSYASSGCAGQLARSGLEMRSSSAIEVLQT